MLILQSLIFITGYLLIAFEDLIKLNKTATALITGVLCWLCCLNLIEINTLNQLLSHHLSSISEIIFFLLSAMVIVELIDAHDGFGLIAQKIKTNNIVYLIVLISLLTFFISAIIDNLTTAIVMVSLIRKLIKDRSTQLYLSTLIIIVSNAGGAWSPMGDVTTTMLWIKGQISALGIIKAIFIPSLISIIPPFFWIVYKIKNRKIEFIHFSENENTTKFERNTMLIAGLSVFLFVPIFKNLSHLPPYLGMILGLGIIWFISEILHHQKDTEEREKFSASYALSRIDSSSILFFLGILLAVSALEASHVLSIAANSINQNIKSPLQIATILGLISAVLDNVPLVAAAMSMFDLSLYNQDHPFWLLLAFSAGTGGSILIIGSAAGVAVMGLMKIEFIWYLKNISLPTLIGYLLGVLAFVYFN